MQHFILRVLHCGSVIRVRTMILIALPALVRNFMIPGSDVDQGKIGTPASTTLVQGITCWLSSEHNDRITPAC